MSLIFLSRIVILGFKQRIPCICYAFFSYSWHYPPVHHHHTTIQVHPVADGAIDVFHVSYDLFFELDPPALHHTHLEGHTPDCKKANASIRVRYI